VLANGNVAPGGTLIVNGSALTDPTQTISVDGHSVLGGSLTLFAGAGNDILIGGAGADLLYGGLGGDRLTGGGGADTFQYRSTSESTPLDAERILDFQSGVDKIDLHLIDANTGLAGDQAFTFIGQAAFSHQAGELQILNQGVNMGLNQWVAQGDTDGDGLADFSLVVMYTNGGAMNASDFLL
jgi:Ca2+-binding RTX toxin-like protein